MMENPWLQIIDDFNKLVNGEYKIRTDVFPALFMGDVNDSPIVLLALNPGFDNEEFNLLTIS